MKQLDKEILSVLMENGPLSSKEMREKLHLRGIKFSPPVFIWRIANLEKEGKISGKRVSRIINNVLYHYMIYNLNLEGIIDG